MSLRQIGILIASGSLVFALKVSAAGGFEVHGYPDDLAMAVKIGSALYETLDARYQTAIQPSPVIVLPVEAPKLAPTQKENLRQVSVSLGFIALLDRIAHAKAIDRVDPGYFDRYIAILAQDTAGANPAELPDSSNPRYWTGSIMNEQSGYFNQMMGLTVAINLSHLYLGSYDKYSGRMPGKLAPINDYLTEREWETGVKAATENALECAFGTAGGKALFEAIGKMPQRPAWASYIVPQNVDVKELNKKLARYERQFFHGDHSPTSQLWTFRHD